MYVRGVLACNIVCVTLLYVLRCTFFIRSESIAYLLEEWSTYAYEHDLFDTRASEGWSAANFPDMCRQWISVALQRGNASLLQSARRRRLHPLTARREAEELM